jgi:hypothetical protein
MSSVAPIITQLALKRGLDPRAVLAVARGEGGLVNRPNDVGDLAGGGSYGPFQLYTKGALPAQYRGRPQAADRFAWSPQGINYALGRMQAVGASGLRGADAVRRIITKFERPYDPQKSIAAALARLSEPGGSALSTGASLPMKGARPGGADRVQPPGMANTSTQSPIRQMLLEGLAKGDDIYDIISMLPKAAAQDPVSAPVSPQEAVSAVRPQQPVSPHPQNATGAVNASGDPGGFVPEFEKRLNRMVAASGGRIRMTSGYRSQSHQARLFADAVKRYGSEEAARKWVAPPGKSKHGAGMAADLAGDLDWAHRNARKFGLHFPMSWEKWHVELQGSRG